MKTVHIIQTANGYWGKGASINNAIAAIKYTVPADTNTMLIIVNMSDASKPEPFIDSYGAINYNEGDMLLRYETKWKHIKTLRQVL